jgi:transcriptional regulator with XRE-family HTH domain
MEQLILNRLKIVLAEKRVKNKELARALGKTATTVSTWCSNSSQPSVETFYEIAKYLEVDLRELFVSTKSNKP